MEDDELDSLALESTHTIDIEKFVPRSEIDERYLDNPYYLTPEDKVGQDAFAVIREAMKRKDVVGLGKVVISRRVEQDAFHDGAQSARAGLALHRLLGDSPERLIGKGEIDALHLEQPLVLFHQRVLGLGQDALERHLVEILERGDDRRSWCNRLVSNAHGAQSAFNGSAVDAISITDEVVRSLIPGERLRYLPRDPDPTLFGTIAP